MSNQNELTTDRGEILKAYQAGMTVVAGLLVSDPASTELRAAADAVSDRLEIVAENFRSDDKWFFQRKRGLHFTLVSITDPVLEQELPRSMERKKEYFSLCTETASFAARVAKMGRFEVSFERALLAKDGVVIMAGSCLQPEELIRFRELIGRLTGSWRYFDEYGRANADIWVNLGRFANHEPDTEFPRAQVERSVAELNPLTNNGWSEVDRLTIVEYRHRGLRRRPSAGPRLSTSRCERLRRTCIQIADEIVPPAPSGLSIVTIGRSFTQHPDSFQAPEEWRTFRAE